MLTWRIESVPKSLLHCSISDHMWIAFSIIYPLAFKNLQKHKAINICKLQEIEVNHMGKLQTRSPSNSLGLKHADKHGAWQWQDTNTKKQKKKTLKSRIRTHDEMTICMSARLYMMHRSKPTRSRICFIRSKKKNNV